MTEKSIFQKINDDYAAWESFRKEEFFHKRTKKYLEAYKNECERLREVLEKIRERALDHRKVNTSSWHMADEALEVHEEFTKEMENGSAK